MATEEDKAAHDSACNVLRCHVALEIAEAKLAEAKKAVDEASDELFKAKQMLISLAYDKSFVVGGYAVIVTTAVAHGVLIQKAITRE